MFVSSLIISVFEVDFNIVDAFEWTVAEALNIEIPNLPAPSHPASRAVLVLNGAAGVIIIALTIGLVVDRIIQIGEAYTLGLETSVPSSWDDFAVFIGWNETVIKAINELWRHSIMAPINVAVILPFERMNEVRAVEKILKNTKASVGCSKCQYRIITDRIDDNRTFYRGRLHDARAIVISMDKDETTLHTLLSVQGYFKEVLKEGLYDPRARKAVIVIEVLQDENESVFRGVASEQDIIDIQVILSRSYGGKLLAHMITQPTIITPLIDAMMYNEGVVDIVHIKVNELDNYCIPWYGDCEKGNILIPLLIISKDGDKLKTELVNLKGSVRDLAGSNVDIIGLSTGLERLSTVKSRLFKSFSVIDRIVELNGQVDLPTHRLERPLGHINIIGFTEATESLIKELKRIRRWRFNDVEKLAFSGMKFASSRTIILSTNRDIFEELDPAEVFDAQLMDSIIVVKGDPMKLHTLRRIGLLSSQIIVVSMNSDDRAVKVVLTLKDQLRRVREVMKEAKVGEPGEPIILAETISESVAERLLSAESVDGAVPSRSLAGRLIAYAILDKASFTALSDLITGTEGLLDMRQVSVLSLTQFDTPAAREIQVDCDKSPPETTLAKIVEALAETDLGIPVAIYNTSGTTDTKLVIPYSPGQRISCHSLLVLASKSPNL
ncbi:MAG: NAD-binding protein [Desulfurococcales archaeon]|nr:NAD-binding protein [Desulfurococcales archaeon]